jgi:hypothetical protein
MTSDRKLEANRRNAARSTGPRSAAGRARSSRNAVRHGLLANFSKDDALSAKTENLAALLAGEGAPRDRLAPARLAAEAKMTVLRARAARVRFLEDALAACSSRGPEGAACGCAPPPVTGAVYLRVLPEELIKLSRYEGEALSQRRRGLWIMKQQTALSSGSSSSSNIQELPNPETNPRRAE